MTTVTVSVTGNDITSAVEGKGIAELQKCVDKMQDGLQWSLLIKSKAMLIETENPDKILSLSHAVSVSKSDSFAVHTQRK